MQLNIDEVGEINKFKVMKLVFKILKIEQEW